MRFTFRSIRHSFTSPSGFRFTEDSEQQLKKSISIKQVISPVFMTTNALKRKKLSNS